MKCKPEDAPNYSCCMMPKPCEGDSCVAWRQYFVENPSEPLRSLSHNLIPMPRAMIESGEGFCGMLSSVKQGQVI